MGILLPNNCPVLVIVKRSLPSTVLSGRSQRFRPCKNLNFWFSAEIPPLRVDDASISLAFYGQQGYTSVTDFVFPDVAVGEAELRLMDALLTNLILFAFDLGECDSDVLRVRSPPLFSKTTTSSSDVLTGVCGRPSSSTPAVLLELGRNLYLHVMILWSVFIEAPTSLPC
jgi:hypothetical protein